MNTLVKSKMDNNKGGWGMNNLDISKLESMW